MLKRKRSFVLSDTPPDIHILTADRQEPLPAHREVVGLFSSVARGLPCDTDGSPTPWDLRGLVLEGESEPVAAAVVERWLDAVYARVDVSRRLPAPASLAETRPLLLLADAVDTRPAVLQALGQALADRADLALTVAVGELKVDLQLKGRLHCILGGALACLQLSGLIGSATTLVAKEAYEPHAAAFPSAVARELESWLHLAGRLNLVPLARALVGFVKAELTANNLSILYPSVGSVFSPRVLQFMPRELLLEGFVLNTLLERPALVGIANEELSVKFHTPLAAACFGQSLETIIQGKAAYTAGGRSVLTVGSATLAATITLGGPSHEECAAPAKQAVAAALED
ncbi:hypothetical protein HYH03_007664 [Edaphochlamys debaryana]|uniref:Uncharacterized protein n=1 Tax=Edaphochlamys debaryana TaxID=47281 RepID=A0A835Y1Q1_9CHLO|nr:hypothetical protein HYH03_007664 [Edaphochlamys debaryana]|eukprot:KAG2494311.1 hypothetical protein HYH03_007664 [Edaphochlamys debaryana]